MPMNKWLLDEFTKMQGGKRLAEGAKYPLSGAPGPFEYRPGPAPAIPFMPAPQVGPQTIQRGGNLGLPGGVPAPQPMADPINASAFGSSYQTPMQLQVSKAANARQFNPGLFNLGMGLMQRGGSSLASLGPVLSQLMSRSVR